MTQAEQKVTYKLHNLISKNDKMQEILERVRTVAKSTSTVLIQGESGTGKELIASAIHYKSPRAGKAFVKFSCADIPPTLIESELFGHTKGAFTNAVTEKKGLFAEAHGGTLFLDEIGELPLDLQPKLLRALDKGEVRPVGATAPLTVDFRLIAATNKDLSEEVKEKRFRGDLFYRLNVISITLPPLRERKEDIPLLVDHFLEVFRVEMGKKVERVSEEAMELLRTRGWPGNVRELKNIIERAVVVAKGNLIVPNDLALPEAGPAPPPDNDTISPKDLELDEPNTSRTGDILQDWVRNNGVIKNIKEYPNTERRIAEACLKRGWIDPEKIMKGLKDEGKISPNGQEDGIRKSATRIWDKIKKIYEKKEIYDPEGKITIKASKLLGKEGWETYDKLITKEPCKENLDNVVPFPRQKDEEVTPPPLEEPLFLRIVPRGKFHDDGGKYIAVELIYESNLFNIKGFKIDLVFKIRFKNKKPHEMHFSKVLEAFDPDCPPPVEILVPNDAQSARYLGSDPPPYIDDYGEECREVSWSEDA